ncbi:hypothetical protein GCM10007216_03420 [Thalassobacillus devorans]|uniref:N-acetyltransferase domain-containing protein n=2 Tax=Thalassobacillus devorans TaxID=279813 RepID=A0ABQ1NG78_9BACI|nr:hypothetical protein GCM10007216_03420 [Thalassobacillus devorans]
MDDLHIRPMKHEELPFVRNQRIGCYEEYQSLVSEEHWNALKGTLSSEDDLKEGVNIYVMEESGSIIGSIVLFPANTEAYEWLEEGADYPEIRMLAVDSASRKKGIGKSLVLHCIETAKKEGHSHIGLHTADFMKNAMALYTNMGFERIPSQDFEPVNDGVIVKAFKKPLK